MGTQKIEVTAESTAPRQAVWAVLADSEHYADWGVWDRSEIEQPGRTERQGLGAVRALTQGRRVLREEVVAFEPGSRFDYQVLSGIPVRDYVGRVDLTDNGRGGTTISWRSSFSALPVIDVLVRRKLQRVINEIALKMAARAERDHAASASPAES